MRPYLRFRRWLLSLSARPGDTEFELHLKELGLPLYFIIGGVLAVFPLVTTFNWNLWFISVVVAAVLLLSGGFVSILFPVRPQRMIEFITLAGVILVCCCDLETAARLAPRTWGVAVVVCDSQLIGDVRRSVQMVTIGTVIAWLAAERLEAVFRGGLYSYSRFDGAPNMRLCNCADPPCAVTVGSAATTWLTYAAVFLTDYHLTRSWLRELRLQVAAVRSSVAVSERLAALLADYSIVDARRVLLEEGEQLPKGLSAAFTNILNNLEMYRAFLPDAVLSGDVPNSREDNQDSQECALAPGERGHGDVCICFTDIQSSTVLWEKSPQGMLAGLRIHNDVVRETSTAFRGYEVKTIGDAFMLAFEDAADACSFGLRVQLRLVQQLWPTGLAEHPLCRRVEGSQGPLWNGLRVRVAIHTGPVRVDRNPVNGRADYFGPTVNLASRLEGMLPGGFVGVTEAVMQSCGDVADAWVHTMGPRDLRGVSAPVSVVLMLPLRLRDRSAIAVPTAPSGSRTRGSMRRLTLQSCNTTSDTGSLASTPPPSPHIQPSSPTNRSAHNTPASSRLALQLRVSPISCAVVRVRLGAMGQVEQGMASCVAMVEQTADQSGGTLATVLSASCVVVWNAAQPCSDHATRCFSFAHQLRFVAGRLQLPVCLGAASGLAMSGNIGGGRRKHSTVLSGCVELATALAEEADIRETNALVVGSVAEAARFAGQALRAALWWVMPDTATSGASEMTRLAVWSLAAVDALGSSTHGDLSKWGELLRPDHGSSEAAVADLALAAVAQRDVAALRNLVAQHPDNLHAKGLLERAEHIRVVPPMWEPDPRGSAVVPPLQIERM